MPAKMASSAVRSLAGATDCDLISRFQCSSPPGFLGAARAGQGHRVWGNDGENLETAILPLPIQEVQNGNGVAASVGTFFPHADDALQMWIGEGLEQYGIHKTEDRRIGTNAEGERSNGNGRKPGLRSNRRTPERRS